MNNMPYNFRRLPFHLTERVTDFLGLNPIFWICNRRVLLAPACFTCEPHAEKLLRHSGYLFYIGSKATILWKLYKQSNLRFYI